MKNIFIAGCVCAFMAGFIPARLFADGQPASADTDTRYGLFGWLDHRSEYGQGVFPEPFLVDDSDQEDNEARLDWLHTSSGTGHTDIIHPEVETGFGLLTVEVEAPYERDVNNGVVTEGMDNIDLGARYPFQQYVSPNGLLDSTFGAGVEVGIPTGSAVSKNAELVPKVFNDLKISNFTLQSIVGYSTLFGPGEDGNLRTFEYGFVFGYTIPHKQLPLPGVEQLIPVFEFQGATELNKADAGHDSLLGNAGFRLNLKAIGRVQPRLGFGYVFPVDSGANQDVHCGFITSLVFEY
jgi:hypothetical protein